MSSTIGARSGPKYDRFFYSPSLEQLRSKPEVASYLGLKPTSSQSIQKQQQQHHQLSLDRQSKVALSVSSLIQKSQHLRSKRGTRAVRRQLPCDMSNVPLHVSSPLPSDAPSEGVSSDAEVHAVKGSFALSDLVQKSQRLRRKRSSYQSLHQQSSPMEAPLKASAPAAADVGAKSASFHGDTDIDAQCDAQVRPAKIPEGSQTDPNSSVKAFSTRQTEGIYDTLPGLSAHEKGAFGELESLAVRLHMRTRSTEKIGTAAVVWEVVMAMSDAAADAVEVEDELDGLFGETAMETARETAAAATVETDTVNVEQNASPDANRAAVAAVDSAASAVQVAAGMVEAARTAAEDDILVAEMRSAAQRAVRNAAVAVRDASVAVEEALGSVVDTHAGDMLQKANVAVYSLAGSLSDRGVPVSGRDAAAPAPVSVPADTGDDGAILACTHPDKPAAVPGTASPGILVAPGTAAVSKDGVAGTVQPSSAGALHAAHTSRIPMPQSDAAGGIEAKEKCFTSVAAAAVPCPGADHLPLHTSMNCTPEATITQPPTDAAVGRDADVITAHKPRASQQAAPNTTATVQASNDAAVHTPVATAKRVPVASDHDTPEATSTQISKSTAAAPALPAPDEPSTPTAIRDDVLRVWKAAASRFCEHVAEQVRRKLQGAEDVAPYVPPRVEATAVGQTLVGVAAPPCPGAERLHCSDNLTLHSLKSPVATEAADAQVKVTTPVGTASDTVCKGDTALRPEATSGQCEECTAEKQQQPITGCQSQGSDMCGAGTPVPDAANQSDDALKNPPLATLTAAPLDTVFSTPVATSEHCSTYGSTKLVGSTATEATEAGISHSPAAMCMQDCSTAAAAHDDPCSPVATAPCPAPTPLLVVHGVDASTAKHAQAYNTAKVCGRTILPRNVPRRPSKQTAPIATTEPTQPTPVATPSPAIASPKHATPVATTEPTPVATQFSAAAFPKDLDPAAAPDPISIATHNQAVPYTQLPEPISTTEPTPVDTPRPASASSKHAAPGTTAHPTHKQASKRTGRWSPDGQWIAPVRSVSPDELSLSENLPNPAQTIVPNHKRHKTSLQPSEDRMGAFTAAAPHPTPVATSHHLTSGPTQLTPAATIDATPVATPSPTPEAAKAECAPVATDNPVQLPTTSLPPIRLPLIHGPVIRPAPAPRCRSRPPPKLPAPVSRTDPECMPLHTADAVATPSPPPTVTATAEQIAERTGNPTANPTADPTVYPIPITTSALAPFDAEDAQRIHKHTKPPPPLLAPQPTPSTPAATPSPHRTTSPVPNTQTPHPTLTFNAPIHALHMKGACSIADTCMDVRFTPDDAPQPPSTEAAAPSPGAAQGGDIVIALTPDSTKIGEEAEHRARSEEVRMHHDDTIGTGNLTAQPPDQHTVNSTTNTVAQPVANPTVHSAVGPAAQPTPVTASAPAALPPEATPFHKESPPAPQYATNNTPGATPSSIPTASPVPNTRTQHLSRTVHTLVNTPRMKQACRVDDICMDVKYTNTSPQAANPEATTSAPAATQGCNSMIDLTVESTVTGSDMEQRARHVEVVVHDDVIMIDDEASPAPPFTERRTVTKTAAEIVATGEPTSVATPNHATAASPTQPAPVPTQEPTLYSLLEILPLQPL